MNKKITFIIAAVLFLILIFTMTNLYSKEGISVDPIEHASAVITWDDVNIYTDPVGKDELYAGRPEANLILITDIHGDHLDIPRIQALMQPHTEIVAPQAVVDKFPLDLKSRASIMQNGQVTEKFGFKIEAIPMYNLPEAATSYHTRGRGNGYVIEHNGERVYISGDTSGIREMKNLQNINIAFVAMNLPYTMGVEEAAEAVLAFKPKTVVPYHYRTPDGFSDIAKFKTLVNVKDPEIEVIELKWYPN